MLHTQLPFASKKSIFWNTLVVGITFYCLLYLKALLIYMAFYNGKVLKQILLEISFE